MPKPCKSDRKILADDVPRIIQLYKDGNTQTDIGIEYGVDHSTIYYYLCKAGVISPVQGKKNWRRSLRRSVLAFGVSISIERTRPTKSYKEYLEDERKRMRRSILDIIIGKEPPHKSVTIDDKMYA